MYNVKNNPKYLNGECTEDELLAKFLQNFESSGIENAEVWKNICKKKGQKWKTFFKKVKKELTTEKK